MEEVILVNESDEVLGTMEKMEAHRKGVLHRAFSVFLFNDNGELLIHQRAKSKYHSPGLWTNTCCSHQRIDESNIQAGKRRLMEELGIKADLKDSFHIIYRAELDQGLTEHELDHVLLGTFNGEAIPNPEEVESWKYVDLESLQSDIQVNPSQYTEWFKLLLPQVIEKL